MEKTNSNVNMVDDEDDVNDCKENDDSISPCFVVGDIIYYPMYGTTYYVYSLDDNDKSYTTYRTKVIFKNFNNFFNAPSDFEDISEDDIRKIRFKFQDKYVKVGHITWFRQ